MIIKGRGAYVSHTAKCRRNQMGPAFHRPVVQSGKRREKQAINKQTLGKCRIILASWGKNGTVAKTNNFTLLWTRLRAYTRREDKATSASHGRFRDVQCWRHLLLRLFVSFHPCCVWKKNAQLAQGSVFRSTVVTMETQQGNERNRRKETKCTEGHALAFADKRHLGRSISENKQRWREREREKIQPRDEPFLVHSCLNNPYRHDNFRTKQSRSPTRLSTNINYYLTVGN